MDLKTELKKIRERNRRVEADKAWETSLFRRGVIFVFVYAIASIVMWLAEVQNFELNALVPAVGYFFSTVTIPPLKKWWVKIFFK